MSYKDSLTLMREAPICDRHQQMLLLFKLPFSEEYPLNSLLQNWQETPHETQDISVEIIDDEEQQQIEASHKFFLSIMGMFSSGNGDYSETIKQHVSEAIKSKLRGDYDNDSG